MTHQRKGDPIIFDKDEHPRSTSIEKLAALPSPFRKNGSVTAGNASQISDGAAACLVMSRRKAEELELTPLATITGYCATGVDGMEIDLIL